jgi:hypothetical protein
LIGRGDKGGRSAELRRSRRGWRDLTTPFHPGGKESTVPKREDLKASVKML